MSLNYGIRDELSFGLLSNTTAQLLSCEARGVRFLVDANLSLISTRRSLSLTTSRGAPSFASIKLVTASEAVAGSLIMFAIFTLSSADNGRSSKLGIG